ncbi:hypothetical protein [Fictibacillus phosphorivorans]|uniref:hypothetical protein n=1 Tax=Fictibacillus phosphorivorans TaxID=1221500 RepID=UPI00203EF5F4|nr:hypothetical protein [Fictibacillus phosphorivorans]MCM3719173.1 hypothetical protein [Fictibacillus phosphorivorans]MCM3776795.1 hypothetical protein [Fictibacillus phosphorivorans]
MNYEEISKLLQYNEYKGSESKIFMPNEIFEDLIKSLNEELPQKEQSKVEYITEKNKVRKKRGLNKGVSTNHIAFAYSYIYLVTWLYRYTKYTVLKSGISNSTIKEILGYKPETRTVNYLIIKNGLLDKIGYLETHKDFPVWWSQSQYEALDFQMYSEEKDSFPYHTIPKNFTIKYPIKGFYREVNDDGTVEIEGTFNEVDNTHCVPFEVFMYCMSKDDIGCTGFYLYSYLLHKNDIYGDYDVSLEDLSKQTGIADRTLDKYLGILKAYRMIDFKINQEFFAIGLREEDRMANTYSINEYGEFSNEPIPYDKINIVKKKDYFQMLEDKKQMDREIWGGILDIPLESLPY